MRLNCPKRLNGLSMIKKSASNLMKKIIRKYFVKNGYTDASIYINKLGMRKNFQPDIVFNIPRDHRFFCSI